VGLDGSGLTPLTDGTRYAHYAAWSPDGSRIALVTSAEYDNVDYRSDIFVMDADGGHQTRLTDWAGFDSFPVWSPDGAFIAFASDRGVTDAQAAANADGAFSYIGIYVMAPDGTEVRPLVPGEDHVALLPSSWTP
jgi:Tol biopolymer transport system component